jgi:hypothetical protein
MYYRVAIQGDSQPPWQWKSTTLSELSALFQFLRRYRALGLNRLRVFSSLSPEEMNEQLVRMNQGLESTSVTAARFLQERLIGSPETAWRTSTHGNERTTSIAVLTELELRESRKGGNAREGRDMNPLEKRREELEPGVGGDHDIPYRFTRPSSMPQVLAWMKLLAKVQDGTLQP